MKIAISKKLVNLKPYGCARALANEGVLMDANESPFGKFNRYPDPFSLEVRRALSEFLNSGVENIFVGNGSDEIIDLLIKAFCDYGDKVLIPKPTYGMYEVAAVINGAKTKFIELKSNFQLDLEGIFRTLNDGVKIIFLCSPNNPLGNCLNDKDILELCGRTKAIVVVDEAYIEFASKKSLVGAVGKYPNLVILRTLSKAWGAAGIRVGYAVASKELIEILFRIKSPYNVSVLNQEAAIKILKNPKNMMKNVKSILREKRRITGILEKLGMAIFPSETNFILFNVPKSVVIQNKLQENGVVVRDRSKEPGLKNALRITIGKRSENDFFLVELEKCLKKVAFIDRDGVILFEPQDTFKIDSLMAYRILPGVVEGLKLLLMAGYNLVMVSNQNGIGTENFPTEDFLIPHGKMIADLAKEGIKFEKIFVCPHMPDDKCKCRKPKIGLVKKYLEENPINYGKSFMAGDRETDMEFAKNIGVKGYKARCNADYLLKIAKKITR